MGRMMSVRVSEKTRREVARIARTSGRTESAVVREAIEEYVERKPARPYDALRGLLGIVQDGPTDLSERTGDRVRKLLLAKRASR